MPFSGRPSLLDLIDDAPFDPALWVDVMERLSDAIGGETAVMTDMDIISGAGRVVPARQNVSIVDDYQAHWASRNPLHIVADPITYLRGWRPRVLRDSEFLARDLLRKTAYYNDFLGAIDAQQGVFIRLCLEGTMLSAISIARPETKGPFDDRALGIAQRYQRPLIRAVRTAQRVGLAQAALDNLDVLLAGTDQLLIFLDRHRRVRRISAAAERHLLSPGVLRLRGERLEAPTANEDSALQALLGRATDGGDGGGLPVTIAVPAGMSRFTFTAVPLGPRSLAATSDERFILLTAIEASSRAAAPTRDLEIRSRFGLTAAEARVAIAIMDGLSLREAAERLNVSIHTVRAQLGTIFGKTSTRRQADLVRLLLRASPSNDRSAIAL